MCDVAGDPAALEMLRAQRSRLADRMRPPWWCWAGVAIVWALIFAGPFSSRYLPRGGYWAIVAAAVAVACLVQWGLVRATGIKMGFRNLRDRQGRPARIATLVVSLAAIAAEGLLIDRGLLVAAIVVAALAVVAEVAVQQAAVRGFRQELRDGGGAA
jgi:hypothetical protein